MTTPLLVCKDCKHFVLEVQTGVRGFCYRSPPQVVGGVIPEPNPKNPQQINWRLQTNTQHPIVQTTERACGEFRQSITIASN